MKPLLAFLLSCIILTACEGTGAPAPTPSNPNPMYQLRYIPYMGGAHYFVPGDVVIELDTTNQMMTIDGALDSIFFYKGTHPYRVEDSTILSFNIRKNEWYPWTTTFLRLPSLSHDMIYYSDRDSVLGITIDYIPTMFDEEQSFLFEKI